MITQWPAKEQELGSDTMKGKQRIYKTIKQYIYIYIYI